LVSEFFKNLKIRALIKNLKFKIKNSSEGVTLVEIIVVIFIITLFSSIIISDFPTIEKHFALSRASYQLAQDMRRIQDLGLSGVQETDSAGNLMAVQGYGIYINPVQSDVQYIIYADIYDGYAQDSQKYSGDSSYARCDSLVNPQVDCVLDVIDISQDNPDLYIKDIVNINSTFTSINFNPPGPTISIDNLCLSCLYPADSEVGIVLGLHSDDSAERTVWINTSGLISVQ
jgi:Tfp pilus assembly protein FimT